MPDSNVELEQTRRNVLNDSVVSFCFQRFFVENVEKIPNPAAGNDLEMSKLCQTRCGGDDRLLNKYEEDIVGDTSLFEYDKCMKRLKFGLSEKKRKRGMRVKYIIYKV